MLNSPTLWHCPVCRLNEEKPVSCCRRCGCNLLLLAKIKIESWQAMTRAEEARSRFLFTSPKSQVEPVLKQKKPFSLLKKLKLYIIKLLICV